MNHIIDPFDMRMARQVASHYGPRTDSDLESAAMAGLLEASRTFDGTGIWRAYARRRMMSRVLDELRRRLARHEDLADPEAMDQATEALATDTTNYLAALFEVPPALVEDFRAALIDLRRKDHREALDAIRESI